MADLVISHISGVHCITVIGELTPDVIPRLLDAHCRPSSGPCACIVDLTHAVMEDFQFVQVSSLADVTHARCIPAPGSRIALVARPGLEFGLCRMFQALRDDAEDVFSIHDCVAAAQDWLGEDAQALRSA